MEFKPDWDRAKEQLIAWWGCGYLEHVTLAAVAPRGTAGDGPPRPTDLRTRWLDSDYRIAEAEHRMKHTFYGGVAFPWFDTHIGPGSLALYLGSPGLLHEETVWYDAVASTPAEVPELKFDPENEWWLANLRLVEAGMEHGRGRYLTSFPDLIENLDIVSSLVGPQDVLYALFDDPEGVKRLIDQVNDLYFTCYDILYDVLEGDTLGTCFSAFQVWGPGKTVKVQCDASAMISREMFAEFVVPALTEQCDRTDFSAYHLDGPHAVQHIDELVKIPGLNAIQWTPGAGQPTTGHKSFFPMYHRIKDAGKGLLLLGTEYKDVERLAKELGPDGVYIGTHAPSVEAAEELLKKAKNW